MKTRGEAKRLVKSVAQQCAERSAETTARGIWTLYWKKYDRRRVTKPKR